MKLTRWPFLLNRQAEWPLMGKNRMLDVNPTSIHQRVPLVVGSKAEMADFAALEE